MKSLTEKLGFAVYTLLITDIWIILFNTLILILNSLYPPRIKEVFITQPGAAEQFEIPVYIMLSSLFVLFIIFTHKLVKKINDLPSYLKIFILLILATFFVLSLGSFPLKNQYDPYMPRSDKSIYFIFVSLYCLISLLVISSGKILKGIFLFSFQILLLALITFDAGFPLTGHDYEHFIGPSYEISQGKTIYTDVLSRYAFLTPVIFALLNNLKILPLNHIPAVVWFLYIVQYSICFYLINKVSKSTVFSLISLIAVLTLNYFSLSHLPSTIPQVGPLRWFPMISLIFLLFKFRSLDSYWFIFSVALASLFLIDSGIAIILSYFTTLLLSVIGKSIDKQRAMKSFLMFIATLIGLVVLINLLHLLFNYKLIDLTGALYSLKKFALSGLSLMPISQKTYFWLVPLIYFTSIIYFFKNSSSPANTSHLTNNILLFSANLSLFASIYFVGRSHPHNLFNISIFPLLSLFLLLGNEWQILSRRVKLLLLVTVYLVFIVFPAFQRRITLTEMLLTKVNSFSRGNVFKSEADEIIKTRYKEEIKLIKNKLPDQTLILSADDSYLFNVTRKKNLLDANPIMGIDVEEDIDFALKNTVKKCPQKIAIDCSYIGKCQSYTPFVGVTFDMKLILSKLEAGCKIKYQPVQCTDKLCILSDN